MEQQHTMKRLSSSKTKIIATVGPAISSEEKLREIILSGIDICRINFSHGNFSEHEAVIELIRKINRETGSHIAILGDLQGPKIRLGLMQEEGVIVNEGDILTLTNIESYGTSSRVHISYSSLPTDVRMGDQILIDDGKIKLEVIETDSENEVRARTIYGGKLFSRKGVNLPDTRITIPSLTEKDIEDVHFMLDQDIEWIALSFVRWANDIKILKKLINERKKQALVLAKIEKPEALEELDMIIHESDAVMVARGDLGVEVSFDKVPFIQKQIVQKCIHSSTPVIIATQMLESMILNFRPTRAEANDVANAVFDCADAVMLSGETSIGKFPVEAVSNMQKIIDYAEETEFVLKHEYIPDLNSLTYLSDSVCYNACRMADQAGAKAIIAYTSTPQTAFHISSYRPKAPIYIFTPDLRLILQMSICWGVDSFYIEAGTGVENANKYALQVLKNANLVEEKDIIVFVDSVPLFDKKGVNTIRLGHV